MLKKILLTTASLAAIFVSLQVRAVSFNFVDIADNNSPRSAVLVNFTDSGLADGDYTGERGATEMYFEGGGLSLTASGSSTEDDPNPDGSVDVDQFAYLDSWSGGPGGLGVCADLSGDQCNPSSDDNITFGESLILVFSQAVTIDQITFNNGDHDQNFSGDFELSIDGGATTTYSLTNIFNTPLTGTEFIFSNPNDQGGSDVSNEYQFYIGAMEVTAVPIPAAVWLFGSGLLGLVAVARRRA
jgi:hypothetical protein